MTDPTYLTIPEVAELLRTSEGAIYDMNRRGKLVGATKVGSRVLVNRRKLIEWLKERETK